MKQQNTNQKLLVENKEVFAELVNALLFDGSDRVKEEELVDAKTESPYPSVNHPDWWIEKLWKGIKFRLILLEKDAADEPDPDLLLRVIDCDGLWYQSQVQNGLMTIYPVITLVLSFGDRPWTGPKSIYERFQIPPAMKPFISNYMIHVFDMAFLTDTQMARFKSVFRVIAEHCNHQRKEPLPP